MKTLFLILVTLLASCGQNGGNKSSGPGGQADEHETTDPTLATDGSNIDGHYLAPFTTLNGHVNGTIPGSASFVRKEARLFAFLRLFAGGPQVWHQQKVYTGSKCPTMADDTNGDGYLDIFEAEAVLGPVLIPLDADLQTQLSGRNFYPVGNLSGSYHYERVVSFQRFFDDLKGTDKEPGDNIIKLTANEPLIIEGKAVMVQGTAVTVEYPETVASGTRYKPFQTLPIACGIFAKVITAPGTPYDGEIPGPVADVEEGQDRPAGEEGTTGGTTVGGVAGGTNESERGESETRDEHGNPRGNTSGGTTGSTTGGSTTGTTSGGGTTGDTTGGTTGEATTGGETGGPVRNPELDPEPDPYPN